MIINLSFDASYLWLPFMGAAIGLLVTIFGDGGGFFYVPLLTILFRVPTQLAAATSLAATIPTVIVHFPGSLAPLSEHAAIYGIKEC